MNFILKFYKNLDAEIDDDKSSITSDFHIGSYLTCVFLYIFIHIYIFFNFLNPLLASLFGTK